MRQRIIQQTLLNFELYIFKTKWLLPIVGILFFGYITLGRVWSLEATYGLKVNAWDAIFAFFGSIYFLLVVLMLPFVYLVSDLTAAVPFEQQLLLKLESRREWWIGKVLTLLITALMYTVLSVVAVLLISIIFAWEQGWSQLAQTSPPELAQIISFSLTEEMGIHHPLNYLLPTILALLLGLFLSGLLAQVIAIIVNNTFVGFMMSATYIVGSIYAVNYGLPYPAQSFFLPVHLQPFLYDAITPPISAMYWIIGIGVLLIVGLLQSRRVDFMA